jgi:hypothetical protein
VTFNLLKQIKIFPIKMNVKSIHLSPKYHFIAQKKKECLEIKDYKIALEGEVKGLRKQ